MYRAATWWAVRENVDLDDPDALTAATERLPLEMSDDGGALKVVVDGEDVSEAIRTPEITRQIYKLDHVAGVRAHLVDLQRDFGARRPTVADGRDMGTVVFPGARWKIYLDASVEERARRRGAQLAEKGLEVDLDALRKDIEDRDRKSMTRKVSPLRKADDAVLLDTTDMTFDEVVNAIADMVRRTT
jgi:cytidylate kinase